MIWSVRKFATSAVNWKKLGWDLNVAFITRYNCIVNNHKCRLLVEAALAIFQSYIFTFVFQFVCFFSTLKSILYLEFLPNILIFVGVYSSKNRLDYLMVTKRLKVT